MSKCVCLYFVYIVFNRECKENFKGLNPALDGSFMYILMIIVVSMYGFFPFFFIFFYFLLITLLKCYFFISVCSVGGRSKTEPIAAGGNPLCTHSVV